MAWVILFLAGLLEIGWAVGLIHGRVYSVLADDRNGHFVGREHGTAGPVAALPFHLAPHMRCGPASAQSNRGTRHRA